MCLHALAAPIIAISILGTPACAGARHEHSNKPVNIVDRISVRRTTAWHVRGRHWSNRLVAWQAAQLRFDCLSLRTL